MKREVIINVENGMILVRYVTRTKRQRHFAAQFDVRYFSIPKVENWVRSRANLVLVQHQAGSVIYAEKMAAFEAAHPGWAELVEDGVPS